MTSTTPLHRLRYPNDSVGDKTTETTEIYFHEHRKQLFLVRIVKPSRRTPESGGNTSAYVSPLDITQRLLNCLL